MVSSCLRVALSLSLSLPLSLSLSLSLTLSFSLYLDQAAYLSGSANTSSEWWIVQSDVDTFFPVSLIASACTIFSLMRFSTRPNERSFRRGFQSNDALLQSEDGKKELRVETREDFIVWRFWNFVTLSVSVSLTLSFARSISIRWFRRNLIALKGNYRVIAFFRTVSQSINPINNWTVWRNAMETGDTVCNEAVNVDCD